MYQCQNVNCGDTFLTKPYDGCPTCNCTTNLDKAGIDLALMELALGCIIFCAAVVLALEHY